MGTRPVVDLATATPTPAPTPLLKSASAAELRRGIHGHRRWSRVADDLLEGPATTAPGHRAGDERCGSTERNRIFSDTTADLRSFEVEIVPRRTGRRANSSSGPATIRSAGTHSDAATRRLPTRFHATAKATTTPNGCRSPRSGSSSAAPVAGCRSDLTARPPIRQGAK